MSILASLGGTVHMISILVYAPQVLIGRTFCPIRPRTGSASIIGISFAELMTTVNIGLGLVINSLRNTAKKLISVHSVCDTIGRFFQIADQLSGDPRGDSENSVVQFHLAATTGRTHPRHHGRRQSRLGLGRYPGPEPVSTDGPGPPVDSRFDDASWGEFPVANEGSSWSGPYGCHRRRSDTGTGDETVHRLITSVAGLHRARPHTRRWGHAELDRPAGPMPSTRHRPE